jgi:hypothetical protein
MELAVRIILDNISLCLAPEFDLAPFIQVYAPTVGF